MVGRTAAYLVTILLLAIVLSACEALEPSQQCMDQYPSASARLDEAIKRLARASSARVTIYGSTTLEHCGSEVLTISRDFRLTYSSTVDSQCFTGIYEVVLIDGPSIFTIEESICPD